MAKKPEKIYSVKIGLINSVLGIFHWKMSNVQVGQMKFMMNWIELVNRKDLIFHHDNAILATCQKFLNGKTVNDDQSVKSHLVQFLADKDQKFYERGIMKLPERWQKVIEQNGKYIID